MTIRDPQGNPLGNKGLGSIRYEFDGYSGSNILVYFGDVLIDEAVNIRFDVQQTKTPVYGYANQYYSFVADGHVFVSGSLVVNFKESGYLLWPIKANANLRSMDYSATPMRRKGYDDLPNDLTALIKLAEESKIIRGNVEQIFQQSQAPGEKKSLNKLYRGLSAMEDGAFEKWAEEFEDVIWFGTDNTSQTRNDMFSKNIRKKSGTTIYDDEVWTHRRADQYPAIDIFITYGDYAHGNDNHTVKKLLDVEFLGQSQIIESSGQPILEEYTFIARNLV